MNIALSTLSVSLSAKHRPDAHDQINALAHRQHGFDLRHALLFECCRRRDATYQMEALRKFAPVWFGA